LAARCKRESCKSFFKCQIPANDQTRSAEWQWSGSLTCTFCGTQTEYNETDLWIIASVV
jgi:hypothetical protein